MLKRSFESVLFLAKVGNIFRSRSLWIGFLFLVCITGALFLFDLRFLSRLYDWDSVVYTHNILTDKQWKVFFNPHHIGFESTGLLYLKFWKWIHGPDSAMFGLRLRILGTACIFILVLMFAHWRLYGDIIGAILLGLAVHFSQGFWFYAQHNDTPLIHSCLTAALYLFCVWNYKNGWSPGLLYIAGFLQVWNIYFHQSDTIFLSFVPISVLLSKKWRGKKFEFSHKLKLVLLYLFWVVLILTVSYLYVGFIILERNLTAGIESERNFAHWLFLYASQERWGASTEAKNYVMNFYRGIGDAFLNFEGVRNQLRVDPNRPFELKFLPYNLNLFFWLGILGLGLLNSIRLWKSYKIEIVLLFFWLIPSFVFYTWWEGYFFEFWVSSVIGLLIFAGLILDSLRTDSLRSGIRSLTHSLLLGYVLLLFIVNFSFSTYPRSQHTKASFMEGIEDKYKDITPEKVYKDE
ncbi:hypothetical protein EHQ27_00540 [Leptospira wolffii]|uniref:hypothetical protein n=1 Tax=Leptospira wolffii TaxID=409998 RepID=UPI001083084F|nr:hypothetical protein [Leptospira wolffii]TGK59416.1 hypothetical protein EHQ32_11570 [Leptospira wolffii]TGK71201.1 hypothetical protein EHQ35_13775 [Leptospira wolffii]TGK77769.1 hypothetical protein EHQ27_00540 [Leptospira wolffii]TGL29521.1 hypothetical protein EHQ57_11380 [Leptospira wolffii]